MAYAIIRIAKLTSPAHAHNATSHNYRQREVPNADKEAPHPNREYLNHAHTDYWALAQARIAQVVTRKVRADQVRAVEVVMTGSPEGFIRGQDGRAADYSKSQWAADNLRFLQEKYGKQNVVSFTLHQDEKTPHVHAVVVPVTPDGRLSAKDLFNREGLRALQTEYAQAMAPHGFVRGVEHSQAEHQPMRRQYRQEADTARQVAELRQAPAPEAFTLRDPPLLGREAWKREEEARINAELARQVNQAEERAQKLAELAQHHTAAAEQAKALHQQLHTAEELKQGHYAALQATTQEKEDLARAYTRTAVRYVQGQDLPELRRFGQHVREAEKAILTEQLAEVLRGKVSSADAFAEKMEKHGYQVERGALGPTAITHAHTATRFLTTELAPNGRAFAPQLAEAVTRSAEQAKTQTKRRGMKM